MKYCIVSIAYVAFLFQTVFGQADTIQMMKQVSQKLEKGNATVSSVLSDTAYNILHPNTSFRQLVEKHAKVGTLTITSDNEPGKKIVVTVTLKTRDGKPIPNALVYLYQTDARGWYAADAPHVLSYEGDMRHARIFGYTKTDKNGHFELHTVKPSGYPQSDLPAHIHIHVTAEGYRSYITELLFDDDERLVGRIRENSVRSRFLIAKPEPSKAPFLQKFTYSLFLD